MIVKTQAIALRVAPYSESSCLVLWMTPDQGKIMTLIKGAWRRRSLFLGQVDVFYTCELLYYWRLNQELHVAKECQAIQPRAGFRSLWRAAACGSYLAALAAWIAPRGAPLTDLYRWLETALDYLSGGQPLEPALFWFELKLLSALGLAPQFSACVVCSRPLGRAAALFSSGRGGVVCPLCVQAPSVPGDALSHVGPDSLGLLRFWQASHSWRAAQRSACSARQLGEVDRLLGLFLQRHLEADPAPRQSALAALRMPVGPPGRRGPALIPGRSGTCAEHS